MRENKDGGTRNGFTKEDLSREYMRQRNSVATENKGMIYKRTDEEEGRRYPKRKLIKEGFKEDTGEEKTRPYIQEKVQKRIPVREEHNHIKKGFKRQKKRMNMKN